VKVQPVAPFGQYQTITEPSVSVVTGVPPMIASDVEPTLSLLSLRSFVGAELHAHTAARAAVAITVMPFMTVGRAMAFSKLRIESCRAPRRGRVLVEYDSSLRATVVHEGPPFKPQFGLDAPLDDLDTVGPSGA
jgi:hypothetical protein